MFFLKKLLAAVALPPFSLILIAIAGVLLSRRHPRFGRALALLALAPLLLLSLPLVSIPLVRSLESYPPIDAQQLAHAQAIVVLGGGVYQGAPEYGAATVGRHSLERVRYAVQLQKRSGLPILVSGGAPFGGRPDAEAMQEVIEREFGGKVRWAENRSRNTAENANLSAASLWAAKVSRVVLVSHAWHLPRALPLFQKQGLEVMPAPMGFTTWPENLLELCLPSGAALAASGTALREWLGILLERYAR